MDRTMFPDAASDALPLERCMRVLPHHSDTGGFFIAVLRKVAPVGDLAFSLTNSRRDSSLQATAYRGLICPASACMPDAAFSVLDSITKHASYSDWITAKRCCCVFALQVADRPPDHLPSAQPSSTAELLFGRKRQLANKAAEEAEAANAPNGYTGFSAFSGPPGLSTTSATTAEPAQEPPPQPPVMATEQLQQDQQPAGGCVDHAEMVTGAMPAELDATAEMETDAAPVTEGVEEVPVTTNADEAAAAPVAVLMDETAADDQGDGAAVAVDAQQTTAATAQEEPAAEANAANPGSADAAPASAAADSGNVAGAPAAAAEEPAPANGAASAATPAAQTGTDKVWGPVVRAQGGAGGGGGANRGKWSGVDPVNFITDEGVLSSLVQYYGFGGPSEDLVRTHLVLIPAPAQRIALLSSTMAWAQ